MNTSPQKSHFLFYAGLDGKIKIQVIVQDETVWASQQAIAEIFETSKQSISYHLKNIFESKELEINSVVKEILTTECVGKSDILPPFLGRFFVTCLRKANNSFIIACNLTQGKHHEHQLQYPHG